MNTDPIADMLTRIRNGGRARILRVSMPSSRVKTDIARVLKQHGYIVDYEVGGQNEKKPELSVEIRYTDEAEPIIEGIERVSRPSRRVYVAADEIPKVRNGIGIAIISTPKGIVAGEEARNAGIGGEVMARVW
ncbi:MAG: 30S ribosomal protein S8 [bacterium]|nr:30S ribosomal protein S8 [bacterium]